MTTDTPTTDQLKIRITDYRRQREDALDRATHMGDLIAETEKALGESERRDREYEQAHERGESLCSECKWTNTGLINLGDCGKPRLVCQGCCKRALEIADKHKSTVPTKTPEDLGRECFERFCKQRGSLNYWESLYDGDRQAWIAAATGGGQ